MLTRTLDGDHYGRIGFGEGSLEFSVGHGDFEISEVFLSEDVTHAVEFMRFQL